MRYRQHHRTISPSLSFSLSLSRARYTRLVNVRGAQPFHALSPQVLARNSISLALPLVLSISLSLSPLPYQAGAADSPPPADVKRVCIFIRGEFQRVTRSKINFPLPCSPPVSPPTRYIYLRHKRTLPPSSLTFRKLCYFFSFLFLTFLIHSLYEALFSRPKNPIPLRGPGIKVETSGTSAFHRKPRMEIARRGQGYRNRIVARRTTRYER